MRLFVSFILVIVILSFSSPSYSKMFMWKEGKSVHVSDRMPAWWPTGSYQKCIKWVPGKKYKIVDKITTLKEKEIKKAQLIVAKKLAAKELKAEELATIKLKALMLETKKKSASNISSSTLSSKPTPKEVMIFCASQNDLFQFPNSSEEASSRKICRKFGISDLELTNIYIKEMEKIGNGNKYPCN
jgi:hypothetical protein